jgi:hypothetical protein
MQRFQGYRHLLPEMRPQDPLRDGRGLTFKAVEHGGDEPDEMPQAVEVTDQQGRWCLFVPEQLPDPYERPAGPQPNWPHAHVQDRQVRRCLGR